MRAILAISLLAGCAKDGNGGDSGGTNGGTAPSFTEVRDEVLYPSCSFSQCHGSGAGYFSITEDMTAAELRDVPSNQIPEMMRVAPGEPDQSYLIWKMEGHADIQGTEMPPPPSEPISDERIQLVRDWIAAGAD